VHWSSSNELFSWYDYNENRNSLPNVKNTQTPNFMKTGPVGTDLFHSCRDTDRHDESDNHFSEFCERA